MAKFLQLIVGVEQDGMIGPKTLAAVHAMNRRQLFDNLMDARLAWLQNLGDFVHFGRAWTSRVEGVPSWL